MACLVVIAGPQEGKYFQLTKRTLVAGRDPARDIQITDPKVSRRHFQIAFHEESYRLTEMKPLNGVFINGERAPEKTLVDGDQIQVGDTVLAFFADDNPDRTDAVKQYKKADRALRENKTLMD